MDPQPDREISSADDAVRAQRQAAALLDMFYSVHYRGNMALEDEMRGALTRKQAAILWLIRSEGGAAGGMRRKDVFRKLRHWFEISNPAVTKSLRGMMRPPLSLVRLAANADSGREKVVFLTAKGERFVAAMADHGQDFLRRLVEQMQQDLTPEEIDAGIRFLRAGIDGYEEMHGEDGDRVQSNGEQNAARSGMSNGAAGADCGK